MVARERKTRFRGYAICKSLRICRRVSQNKVTEGVTFIALYCETSPKIYHFSSFLGNAGGQKIDFPKNLLKW